jgi:predicted permease
MVTRVLAYLRGLAHRRRIAGEVDDELRFHIEQEVDAHVARGVPRGEARRLAMRDLGGLSHTRESVRDVRTIWLDLWWRDLRYAIRALRRTPAFTATALTVLTLSIGVSTAIFSVVDAVVLRALPFDESDRLVAVGERSISDSTPGARHMATPQNFFDWREQQDVFTGLAAVAYGGLTLRREGDELPVNLHAPMVTADFFSVLRVRPVLGRAFTAEDEAAGPAGVAVISYGVWQRRFGGSTDVIGTLLPVQRGSFEIVGVMPPGFSFGADEPADVWVPYIAGDDERVRGNTIGRNLHVVGRLREGVAVEQAQAGMDQITAGLAAETPAWFTDRVAHVEPLQQSLTRGVRTWMFMLLAAVSLVLLIACVNLANLMLVRGATRVRELGVRAALGASGWQLSRVLLLESLVLSVTGAALGAMVAWWGVEILTSAMPADTPRLSTIAIDFRVLAVTAVTGVVTGLAFGWAPVLRFSRPVVTGSLHQRAPTIGGRGAPPRLRGTLIVAEVALAVVLLVGSGLFLASFARVIEVDLGFDHRDVLTVRIRVLEIPDDRQRFSERNRGLLLNVLERVRSIPGVEVAALAGGALPLRGDLQTVNLAIPGRVLPRNTDIDFNVVSPDYFTAIRVPLLAGRFFTDADVRTSESVVILSEAAADRYFPGEDPVGKVIQVSGRRTVVGVAGNVRQDGPEGGWRTQAFVPFTQSAVSGATLLVRTAPAAGAGVLPAVRQAVWIEFPDTEIPIRVDEQALGEYLAALVAQRRFSMLLLALFGGLGLIIAAVGIYGVMSYRVTQRTQEIGVRMALGARPSSILSSVLRATVAHLAVGLTIGLSGAWVLAELVEGFLFEVRPHDPAILAGVVSILAVTGLAAAFLPARRAAGLDPLVALRTE